MNYLTPTQIISEQISDNEVRKLIKIGCQLLLKTLDNHSAEAMQQRKMDLIAELKQSPIALHTDEANEQHYEVDSDFYHCVLGQHKNYSCCYWPEHVNNLDEAEECMLRLFCERADIQNGQHILELGCGWGSFSLYAAKKFPDALITGVSNSASQREYILRQAKLRNINNLEIITANVTDLTLTEKYDRIVSIEMFEHLRNYQLMLSHLSDWLNPHGKVFIHIFVHRDIPYIFKDNWIADHFFTGGMMPSSDLLLYFPDHFKIRQHWLIDGTHYQKTSNAWLERMDKNKAEVEAIFSKKIPSERIDEYIAAWRLFFITTAESFGYSNGQEWMVAHYLLEKHAP